MVIRFAAVCLVMLFGCSGHADNSNQKIHTQMIKDVNDERWTEAKEKSKHRQ